MGASNESRHPTPVEGPVVILGPLTRRGCVHR